MWKRNSPHPLRVILDTDRRKLALNNSHEALGHRGEQAVFETMRVRYYWPHMRADIKHHVASCHDCQIRNIRKFTVPPTISTPAVPWQKVYLDVMFMPQVNGYRYIIAARDDLTRYAEGKALRKANSKLSPDFSMSRYTAGMEQYYRLSQTMGKKLKVPSKF